MTEPTWVPSMYADQRAAWEGPHVDHPEIPVRIEAASFKGQVVHFAVVFPWDIPYRQQETFTGGERLATILLCAVFLAVVIGAGWMGRRNLKQPTVPGNVFMLGSVRTMLAVFLSTHVVMSVFAGFGFLFFLLLLYVILRRQWPAIAAMFLITLLIELAAFAAAWPRLFWIVSTLISLTIVTVTARFGLLATMAHQLFFFLVLMYPLTTDFSAWYAPSMVFALVLAVGLAVYGFYTSLGGQSLFGGRLLQDD